MNIQITSRHSKASHSLQESITRDIMNLEKFSDKITSCHVVLDNEYVDKTVEIVVNVLGNTVSANGKGDNVGKAVDQAVGKIERQIKKVLTLSHHILWKRSKLLMPALGFQKNFPKNKFRPSKRSYSLIGRVQS